MNNKERFTISISDEVTAEARMHQSMELLFILEGSMNVCVEKRVSSMKENDILVINANRNHFFQKTGDVLYLQLMVNQQVLNEVLKSGENIFWCDSSETDDDRFPEFRHILRRMLSHYIEQKGYAEGFGYIADVFEILDYLTKHFLVGFMEQKGNEDGERYEERIQQINNYIYSNYDQQISMKELSEKLFLSNGYLSRFFKKNYGMNFASYLTSVRLFYAVDDLLYSDAPITRIAYKNGFTSAALFNKVFKKEYGLTPTEFRRKEVLKRETGEESEHQKKLEKRLEHMLVTEEQDSEEAGLSVKKSFGEYSAADNKELPPYWNYIINFGEVSNLLYNTAKEHLLILKSALNFKYVRFWSLFSEDFFNRPGQEEFNFNSIDTVLDIILEMDLKPFIDFGLKPDQVVYGINHYQDEENITLRKIDAFSIDHWKRIIRSFMSHIGNRYGQSVTDDWRIELWYDEEWRRERGKEEKYLELFEATRNIIKNFNEKIQVGGYGIRMDMGEDVRLAFLKKWNQSDCRPDFLTVSYYAYVRGEDGLDRSARRNTDHDAFFHMVSRERRIISEAGLSDLPIYLNEWNLTPSVRNFINDSTFKGAYILKNIIDLCGTVDGMGYGSGSDLQYASYDTTGELFGGTGLITRDGILKPAAFAFEFLNRLFPYYIGKTGSFLVTTDRHDNYSIICHNQQNLSLNYYLTAEWEIEKDSLWKYFEDRKKMHLQVRLRDVADGSYRVKIYRINDLNGSVLNKWKELEYEKELSRNDLKYLRRVCEPNLTMRKIQAVNGVLTIEEELLPNEIAFIRVRRRHDE